MYFIATGKKKIGNINFKFEILGCQCKEIILYDFSQNNWQVFPFEFKTPPYFNLDLRRFVFK